MIPLLGIITLAQGQFGPQLTIESNETERPQCLLATDLDLDGWTDLVVSLQVDDRIAWFRNEGQGVFGAQQTLIPNADDINAMDLADLDGDGDADLIGTSLANDHLLWWPNNGPGVFGAQQAIDPLVSEQPTSLFAKDLDGDGDIDVVHCSRIGNRVAWCENLGGAVFAPSAVINDQMNGPMHVHPADLDADGAWDILSASFYDDKVAWYRNLGNGDFSTEMIITLADSAYFVLATDVNGDGHADVVTADGGTNELIVVLNDGGTGFLAPVPIAGGLHNVLWIAAFDPDQDGDQDLACTTAPNDMVILYTNDGAGIYGPGDTLATEVKTPLWVQPSDLDGDGLQDLAYLGYQDDLVAWHRNEGNGSFGAQREVTTQVSGASWASTGDLDGDGDLDVVSASLYDNRVAWYENLGNGVPGPQRTISTQMHHARCAIVSDADNDGDLDVIASSMMDSSVVWFANAGNGDFPQQHVITSSAAKPQLLGARDLDADGDTDVVASGYSFFAYFLNDGFGNFDGGHALSGMVSGDLPFALADLDGDTLCDIVHTTSGYGRLAWFRNLGNGTFGPQVEIAQGLHGILIAIDDMDGDGDPDIVAGDIDPLYFPNNGDGTFALPVQFGAENSEADAIVLMDIQDDGFPDVVVGHDYLDQIAYYLNLGNGSFSSRQVVASLLDGPYCFHAARLDASTSLDLICAAVREDHLFWHRNYFGSPYHAGGTQFIDTDLDGVRDTSETGIAWGQLSCTPYVTYALTDLSGSYTFNLDTGVYTISGAPQSSYWTVTTSPPSHSVHLTDLAPIATGLDLGYAPTVDTCLIIPSFVFGDAPCGMPSLVGVNCRNEGTRIEHGTITFALDTLFTILSSQPPPQTQSGNTLTWTFDSLAYFEVRTILLEVEMPGVGAMGDTVTSELTVITQDSLGNTVCIFTELRSDVLTCAYDPNDKAVLPAGYGTFGAVDITTADLDYVIRFQNTGSAPAHNVILRDEFDQHLDLAQFQIIGYSHTPTEIRLDEGELEVRFVGIMLPDSGTNFAQSQGFIHFRIGVLPASPNLTSITNTSSIHFDANPAIQTNTTLTTLVDCALWHPDITTISVNMLTAEAGLAYQWFVNGDSIPGATGQLLGLTGIGTYRVEVTNVYGCTALSDPLVVTDLGIQESLENSVLIMPNPFTSHTKLVFNEVLTQAQRIEVVDACGRSVRTLHGNGTRSLMLYREDLAPGPYMIRSTGTAREVQAVLMVN